MAQLWVSYPFSIIDTGISADAATDADGVTRA